MQDASEAAVQLTRFRVDGGDRVGYVDGAELVEVETSWSELLGLALENGAAVRAKSSGRRWSHADCEVLKPLDEACRGVFCIGLNYREHTEEVGNELGETPTGRPPIFFKLVDSMVGPTEPIVADPAVSKQVDWEVELGVVIGKAGRHIPVERVHEHIVGYTIVVDTTSRDLQREHVQWFMGKNAHAASPIGPCVVTADAFGFPPALEMSLSVNGVEKQRARTDKMMWSIAEFVAMTSDVVVLQPGDVFATGSPPGVGFARRPPEFLAKGDVLRAEIDGIGVLEHAVE